MRILEVIPALSSGGAERFVVDLCNQMEKDGHEVTLLTMKNMKDKNYGFYQEELSPKIKHINLALGKFGLQTFFVLYKTINNIDCDIVHFHLSGTFFGVLSILFDRNKKFVVTSHIQAENEWRNHRFRSIVKKICLKGHLLNQVAISHQNEKSIIKVYGVPPVKLIYNGRASVSVTHDFENVKQEVFSYKTNKDTLVFTLIARCSSQKNIPKLIRCFNLLVESGENITLIIIGDGYNSPEMQPIIKTANTKIHFLGQRHNVVDYLTCSDFFTLSSDYEGMPITLIEALSCGCVPVGTPVSGFNDIVENGITGFVAKDFSDEAYIDALKEVIAQKNRISADYLKKTYNEKLSMEACAIQYESLFERLLNKK